MYMHIFWGKKSICSRHYWKEASPGTFYSVKSVGCLTSGHIFRIAYLEVLGLYGSSINSWEEKAIIESFPGTAF